MSVSTASQVAVGGADFSGAANPSGRIWCAYGSLTTCELHIEEIRRCDDRLDLFQTMITRKGVWGLDAPFSLPAQCLTQLGLATWEALLQRATDSSRQEFIRAITDVAGSQEARCSSPSAFCRVTDVAARALSPLKRHNPDMATMTYAGIKLVAYLRRAGMAIYPFDALDADMSVMEVYPSALWAQLGSRRYADIRAFLTSVHEILPFAVTVDETQIPDPPSQDACDAVVACVTLALIAHQPGWPDRLSQQLAQAAPNEWCVRRTEGMIIRHSI